MREDCLNFLLTKRQLLDSITYYLEYAFSNNWIASIAQRVASAVEDVHMLFPFLLFFDVYIKSTNVKVFAEETDKEHKLKDLKPDVFLVRALRKYFKQVLSIEVTSLKEYFDKV